MTAPPDVFLFEDGGSMRMPCLCGARNWREHEAGCECMTCRRFWYMTDSIWYHGVKRRRASLTPRSQPRFSAAGLEIVISRVVVAVSKVTGIGPDEMFDTDIGKFESDVVRARYASIWLIRETTNARMSVIARKYGDGIDHTTVLRACKVISRKLEEPSTKYLLQSTLDILTSKNRRRA